MPQLRNWFKDLIAKIFPSKQGYRQALKQTSVEGVDINLDVKLQNVRNAVQKLEKKTDELAREADKKHRKYERLQKQIQEAEGGRRERLFRDAYKVKQEYESISNTLKKMMARHQTLVDVELKILDAGRRKQIQMEMPEVTDGLDELRDLREELDFQHQETSDELQQTAEAEEMNTQQPDWSAVREDMEERRMAEMEETFGNIEEDLFKEDGEQEIELG